MAFRSAALTEGAPAGGSLVANTNSGLAAGDRILVFVSTDLEGDEADVAISGYANRGTQSISTPDGHGVVLFERIADGSETGTVTVTGLASSDAAVIFASWSGRHSSAACTFITPSTSTGGVEPQTINATGGTAAGNDDIAVFVAGSPNFGTTDYTWTPPGGYTERIDPGTHRAWVPATLATSDNVSAGATGALSVTLGSPGTTGESVGLLAWVVAIPVSAGDTPTVDSLSPADGATGVSVSATLGVNFNQDVQAGTGNVRIVEDIAPTSAPTVQARNTDAQNTNATQFVVDIPGAGSIQAGDLAIIAFTKDDNEAPTGTWPPTGWNIGQSDASGTVVWGAWIYRWCDGSTDGTTVTLDESTENWLSRGWLIRGADTSTSPVGGTVATGTSTAGNPPSVTCPGGTEPHLILYYVAIDGNSSVTGHPGGYTDTGSNTTTDATTGNRVAQGYGELASTVAGSDDPGAITNTSNAWKAFTIAIRPLTTRTTRETISITNTAKVVFASDQVTISPTAGTLRGNKQYHVEIDSGAIQASDDATNWGGISNVTTWNFATGTAPAQSTLVTQKRAKGFPPRAQVPGISRLGVGLLVGVVTPSSTPTGTASAATSSFDASATGLVTFSGSGSAAASPFAASGSGTSGDVFTGAGSAALAPFASAAAGLETFSGTGSSAFSAFSIDATGATVAPPLAAPFAQPQPQTFGFKTRYPMPPLPRLGAGILKPGAPAFSSFVIAELTPFAVTATGAITFVATGSAAVQPFAGGATGTETFPGTGSAAIQPFAGSAAGAEAFAGTSSASVPSFACSATGAEAFTGACSAAAQPFAVGALGTTGNAFNGSASCELSPFAVSASGAETFSGSASAACSSFAISCAGAEAFAGSGSAACQPFAVAASGALGASFSGSVSAAVSPFGTSSSGAESFSSSGAAAASPFGSTASGLETFSGSASAALSPFACSASGLNLQPITGTATCALAPFAASAAGLHIQPIVGTGEAALSPFACTAIGGDNIPIGPFDAVGFTRIAPEFTASSFTEVAPRFTAVEFDP